MAFEPPGRPPWSDQVRRSAACRCCHRTKIRIRVRVGTPADADYAVAVCPDCDRVDLPVAACSAWAVAGPLTPGPVRRGEQPWSSEDGSAI